LETPVVQYLGEVREMAQFLDRYWKYRQAGLGPVASFRFAWLVGRALVTPAPVRSISRRPPPSTHR